MVDARSKQSSGAFSLTDEDLSIGKSNFRVELWAEGCATKFKSGGNSFSVNHHGHVKNYTVSRISELTSRPSFMGAPSTPPFTQTLTVSLAISRPSTLSI